MTASNLAVVMGPNICRPEKLDISVEALAEAQCVNNAVITLIVDYEQILPREPPSSDKNLAHVKRKSRVDNFMMVPGLSLPSKTSSTSDDIVSVKEAEDAIDSKLSLSLSELKPDIAVSEPMSARGPARSRQRAQNSARNRGFSNALEWLVASADTLDEPGDLPVLPEEEVPEESLALASSTGSSGAAAGGSVTTLSPSNSATLKSRRRMSKKAKTANEGTTSQAESPREFSTASTSTNGSEIANVPLNISAGRRSKKLRSESSGNSTSAETGSSTSEPPSPRDGKSTSSGSGSGHKKKKSNKSSASASGDSPRRDPAEEETAAVPSPRRRILPPSREGSIN